MPICPVDSLGSPWVSTGCPGRQNRQMRPINGAMRPGEVRGIKSSWQCQFCRPANSSGSPQTDALENITSSTNMGGKQHPLKWITSRKKQQQKTNKLVPNSRLKDTIYCIPVAVSCGYDTCFAVKTCDGLTRSTLALKLSVSPPYYPSETATLPIHDVWPDISHFESNLRIHPIGPTWHVIHVNTPKFYDHL